MLSNVIAAKANTLAMLLAARVMLGAALGGFGSMSAAQALRLVPAHQFARAMSFILSGVSVATVCAGIARMLTSRYRAERRVAGG